MRRRAFPALLLIAGFLGTAAFGGHVEPAKASKFTFSLVNGYFPCDTPNTATQSAGLAACTPTGLLGCGFSPTGSGALTFMATGSAWKGNQDIRLAAVAKGLMCEGADYHIRLSFRATTDDCPEGPCTTIDLDRYDLDANGAFCVVTNGICKIKTTLSMAAPGLFPNGKATGIVVLGCGLKEFAFPLDPPELPCGILLK